MKRKILFFITFLLVGFSVVFGAYTISDWRNTQSLVYESGLGQTRVSSEFTTDGCGYGTILDKVTNLCWEQAPNTSLMNWTDAVSRCDSLNLGGSGNWVLPQKAQLMTLLEHSGASSTYNHLNNNLGFTGIMDSYYWSNTKYSTSLAFVVRFDNGRSSISGVTNSRSVVCLRLP